MRNLYSVVTILLAVLLRGNFASAQSTTFSYTTSVIQTYTVPAGVTSLNITARGAEGGISLTPAFIGGYGAIVNGIVTVVPGHVLNILVGESGGISPVASGGGGGTFVWDASATTPLIVAGGGGGASSTENGISASLTIDGTDGGGGTAFGGGGLSGSGGTPPTGGSVGPAFGAGGCGWLSNGANGNPGPVIVVGTTVAQGGMSPHVSTGAGGAGGGTPAGTGGAGGFGGGGGGQYSGAGTPAPSGGAGGGGGYSGGGGGVGTPIKGGGGGGSFCSGTISSRSATNTGNGLVIITLSCGPGVITGNATLCVGATEALSDTPSGGTWVSTNTSIATVDGFGTATGVAPGTDTILYIVFSSCGVVDTASATLMVNSSAAPGTISGTPILCVGTTTMLSDATSGGSWSASNSNASIAGGLVTGAVAGMDTIYYTNPCGGAYASVVVTINPTASAGTITGTLNVCVGSSTTLTDVATGGTWSSGSTTIATMTGGTVYGASAGTSTIRYTVPGACGTATASAVVTVGALPSAGTITGTSVCMGSTATITATGGGTVSVGTWSSSNTSVAVVGVGTGPTTTVTPVAPGTSTITYSVSNSCGTATATAVVTVSALPVAGTISGATTVCIGASITLTDGATGGSWSATNTDASVSGGIVTGVAAGVDIIEYSVSNSCGTATASQTVTINAAPSAGTISGASTVCIGTPITLTDAASGGTWSASNTNATVVAGTVTGVMAGTDNITYTVSNSCGSNTSTFPITISTAPTVDAITGTDSVCTGHAVTLSDAITGGAWTCSNTKATVAGGVVTGVAVGTDTVTYTVTNACGTADTTLRMKVKSCPSEVNTVAASSDELAIYPNPANEELTIKMREGSFSSFAISNYIGQVLMEQQLNSTQTNVNIKSLPPSAIYYITFRGQNGISVQRFIKL